LIEIADYISSLSFDLVQPDTARVESLRFPLERAGRPAAELLELPGAPADVYNARLPAASAHVAAPLRAICGIPRMSTYAVAASINHAVARMPADQSYLNVGVYAGFSLLAGMIGNPERVCIGVDNFSRPAGREGLLRRFDEMKSPAHRFHEMDYLDYFADVHTEPLGAYLYDGDHAYEHQVRGLEIAEPFYADGCLVIVDDTNWEAPRQATIDFVAASEREYEVLLDSPTRDHNHPTFWNGLMVLRATGRRRTASPAEVTAQFAKRSYRATRPDENVDPADGQSVDPDAALVSIVVVNEDPTGTALEEALDACAAQTWPRTEVVVLDSTCSDAVNAVAERHAGEPEYLEAPATSPAGGVSEALARTRGELVGFIDSAVRLRPTAVELAIHLPPGSRFFTSFGDMRYAEHERAVLGR
jgi:hypothetical protein